MIVVVDLDDNFRSWAVEQLTQLDDVMEFQALDDGLSAALAPDVTVLLIGPNQPTPASVAGVEQLVDQRPALSAVLVLAESDPQLLRSAIHAGARDVLTYPFDSAELLSSIERAESLARKQRNPASSAVDTGVGEPGKVITVFSTKGGSGKSLIATNLPFLIGQSIGFDRVAIFDLDLQSGDVSIILGLDPKHGILEAAESPDRLDAEAVKAYLTQHSSGLSVLTAPVDPSHAETIGPAAITTILHLLRQSFDYVVVDAPAQFSEQVLAAFDVTDEFILIASLDVPSLKSLRVALNTMKQLGIDRNRIKVAINRANSKVGLTLADVEKSLDVKIIAAIPSSRDVPLSYNSAEPLALGTPGSDVLAAIAKLLPADVVVVEASDKNRRRRFARG